MLPLLLVCLLATASSQQFIHPADEDPCRPVGGVRTSCKSLAECPQAVEGIRKGRYPKICNFRGVRPDVCCPEVVSTTSATPPTSRPSEEGDVCDDGPPQWYCRRYSQCQGVKQMIRQGQFPKLCQSGKGALVICCPPHLVAPPTTDSSKMDLYTTSSATDSSKMDLYPSSSTTDSSNMDLYPTSSTTDSSKMDLYPASSTTDSSKMDLYPSSSAAEPSKMHLYPSSSTAEPSKMHLYPSSSAADSWKIHLCLSSYSTESSKQHLQPSSSSPESFKQHLQPSSSSPESSKQHLQPSSSSLESSKQHLQPSSSSTESSKQHLRPTSSSTESSKQHLQPSSSSPESSKQHLQPSSSSPESSKQHLQPSSSSTESSKQHLRPSSSSTEQSKQHVFPQLFGMKVPILSGSGFNKAPPRKTKADQMCESYGQYVFKKMRSPALVLPDEDGQVTISFCGRVAEPLIVGGEDARPREFPHMARIGYGSEVNIQWLCGGSLISERFILSAAHCAKMGGHRLANWANLGDLDTSTEEDEADPVTIRISERFVHPGYTGRELYHDIALFKLIKDAPLGIYIRPICLNTRRTVLQSKATATGWGLTQYRGRGSSKLQKVEVEMVDSGRCNNSYSHYTGKGRQLPSGIVADYMLCAGGDGRKDSCQGDSGGPLQIALDSPYCMYSVIGVTSFGRGCGTSTPGVYTNVFNYLSWIEAVVWPSYD